MNTDDVDRFEKVVGQLQSVYDELTVLSKKNPSDALNKFKIRFVNRLLAESLEVLGEGYRPFDDFTEFDVDDMPQNSDVVFILGQYLQCFEKLRADNSKRMGVSWFWYVRAASREDRSADEKGYVTIPTVEPRRLRE
jgi:hypothetical protein